MIEPLTLTADQAATMAGIGRATWWRLHAAGKTPAPLRLGRATRWLRHEILAWLAAGAPIRERWEAIRPDLDLDGARG